MKRAKGDTPKAKREALFKIVGPRLLRWLKGLPFV